MVIPCSGEIVLKKTCTYPGNGVDKFVKIPLDRKISRTKVTWMW